MRTCCPRCERATYWLSRGKTIHGRRRPDGLASEVLMAVTSDGYCATCWRVSKGKERPSVKGVANRQSPTYRAPMTDAAIAHARQSVINFLTERRRRGIDPEGQDPAALHRSGLTLMDV